MEERLDRLRGLTIDPKVANDILAHADNAGGPVLFDGFGRIEDFSPLHQIQPALVSKLENAVIEPLTSTNARGPRDAPRAERDILVRAMHLLGMEHNPVNQALLDDAKKLFLSGSFSRNAVASFLENAVARVDDVLLHDQFTKLATEIAKPVTVPQLADNLYGRTFESLLVDDLVRWPPNGMLRATRELGRGVVETLRSYPPAVFHEMVDILRNDVRPWFGLSPSMARFLAHPSMSTFEASMSDTSSGIEAIKVINVAQRMVLAIHNVSERGEIDRPGWYQRCFDFYSDFLSSQKPGGKSQLSGVFARNPGNWLHYQPNAASTRNPWQGTSWTHSRVVTPDRLSLFEQDALARGQPIVNGASGQTGMVVSLAHHVGQTHPNMSHRDLHLAIMTCLVFNGGHSTEEVLFALDATKGLYAPARIEPGWASGFRGGYEAIAELGGTEADKRMLRDRMDTALKRTIAYHAKYAA
ncbi:hypothetical protein WKR88_02630 [Trinickia caryophylli]|nr:hypothetical protein [Trinickia caryophylli]PMS11868.1 hypothetical protein C0Z17_11680 [Trinickia caryophylli]WQE13874.1 hypothetical protein U0034_24430 [Trinickia caryophylli]GLU33576.1 hypothetical protein Busp01_34180 [Trinickia caryophylli]